MKNKKKRLDLLLQEQLSQLTRNQISSFIIQGKVKVEGRVVTKPGVLVSPEQKIECDFKEPKYVCRAGFKLEKALDEFQIDPQGYVVMDAGLSTGGFTDCLLQRGTTKVYGIDVGYGQVHEKIRADDRVVVMERTNLRYCDSLPELVDLITLDLSFISTLKVMDTVKKILKPDGELVVLIKPQFEAEKYQVGKGGIIRDDNVRNEIKDKVVQAISKEGFELKGLIESPITGTHGNIEFLGYFKRI